MPRLAWGMLLLLSTLLVQPAVCAQETDQEGQQEQLREERKQQREARREERQRQIDSLTDEQRQALRERQRIRAARGAAQRGQRVQRRRPPINSSAPTAESENDEPTQG